MARKKRYRKYVERPTAGGFRLLPACLPAGWLLQVGCCRLAGDLNCERSRVQAIAGSGQAQRPPSPA